MAGQHNRDGTCIAQLLAASALVASGICITASAYGSVLVMLGGSQGGGGVPALMRHLPIATVGCIVNPEYQGLAGLVVVITDSRGAIVAIKTTDEAGLFVALLPEVNDLQLAVIGTAVSGVAVEPGVPLTVVVP